MVDVAPNSTLKAGEEILNSFTVLFCSSKPKPSFVKYHIFVSDHLNRILSCRSFSEHATKISSGDVMVVDVEEGFSARGLRREGFSDFSIKPGRGFEKKSYTNGVADHKQIGDVIFIPASLSGTRKAEMSPDPIVGAAIDHHHINIGINDPPVVAGPKPKFVVKRSHSGRGSLPWILRPRRLLFLFAMLSITGTMILIYLTLLISKGNNPTM